LSKLIELTTKIRAIVFYFFYGLMTLFVSSAAFISKPFLPYHLHFAVVSSWSRFSVYAAKYLCGIRFEISGLENVPKDTPYVAIAKHQSQWETYFLMYLLSPICIVCKKELLKIPFFGYCLSQIKPIAIDRNNPKQALKTIQTDGLERLQQRRTPVLIFPEGTRTPIGQRGKYARSAAALAIKAQVPVILISHNAGYCWPSGSFNKKPGVISVHISAPINTDGRTARDITEEAEQWIEAHVVYHNEKDRPAH
jgi:1-acyl-sn-glycerol-3-phosphate acyltransferase